MEVRMEDIIMNLVVNSGEARSKAMEAIGEAKKGEIDNARILLSEAETSLGKSHDYQMDLICAEAGGEQIPMSLIMVHGQDHLMNAMVILDLAKEFVELYEHQKKA